MCSTFTQLQILVVLGTAQFTLWTSDRTVEVTEELLHQHEEQRSQEMALLLEMEQRSQESPGITQGSMLLSACEYWWFWASAEMLLMLFGYYWLPRQGSSSYDSSACGETPAEPRRKRRRQRRKKSVCGIADNGDKLEQISSLDQCLEQKDMENLEEEEMKGMINASAKPFPQKTSGETCSGYDSSACGETPAEPRKKKRRQRRKKKMRGIADNGDKLEQISSLDQHLEQKDMENSEEEEMKGMIKASAKPFPQKTSGETCSGYDSSACGETPAEPRKKKRRQRRKKKMRGIADNGDKLEQISSLDQHLEQKDMENSEEEEMKGMINASAKPFPQKTSGETCSGYDSSACGETPAKPRKKKRRPRKKKRRQRRKKKMRGIAGANQVSGSAS